MSLSGSARADQAIITHHLPSARNGASAVWTGSEAYVFGGNFGDVVLQDIVRFSPLAGEVATVAAVIPGGRTEAAAAWNGTHAFLFGGRNASGGTDAILRFDPESLEVRTMDATLPYPLIGASAVWTGGHALIFGGAAPSGESDRILRYDPVQDELMLLNLRLPTPRVMTAAAWDGAAAYVVGGTHVAVGDNLLDEVVRYDPAANTVDRLSLPYPVTEAAAAWVDGALVVLGGRSDLKILNAIIRVDPAEGTARRLYATLPSPKNAMPAVAAGRDILLFGGGFSDDIVAYDPTEPQGPPPNRPPTAHIATPPPQECHGGRAEVVLYGIGSSDPDGDPLGFRWSSSVRLIPGDPGYATGTFPLGLTEVRLTVSDGQFEDTATASVVVQDTRPPSLALVRPTQGLLYIEDRSVEAWPSPTNQTYAVGALTVGAEATDQCQMQRVEFSWVTSSGAGTPAFAGTRTLSSAPFVVQLDPPAWASGHTLLVASAFDTSQRSATLVREWAHTGLRTSPTPTLDLQSDLLPGDVVEAKRTPLQETEGLATVPAATP